MKLKLPEHLYMIDCSGPSIDEAVNIKHKYDIVINKLICVLTRSKLVDLCHFHVCTVNMNLHAAKLTAKLTSHHQVSLASSWLT